MRIGIAGAGMIGGTLAKLLLSAGHEIKIAARDTGKLAEFIAGVGERIESGSISDVVAFGDLTILALPRQSVVLELALPDGLLWSAKIVIDAIKPYRLRGGGLHRLGKLRSSEQVAKVKLGATLVKAFNTIYWIHLRDQARHASSLADRRAIFVAGDEKESKERVFAVIDQLGFAPIDTGGLRASAIQEPGGVLYNNDLKGAQAKSLLESVRQIQIRP